RVTVIGGGGFLGSHLVDLLRSRGCEPATPRTADGWDFRQPQSAAAFFAEHKPQVVFNCGARQGGLAYQRQFPAEIYYDNMLLGLNSLHAAQAAGVEKYINVVAACSYPGYLDGLMSEADYWSGPLHDSVVNYGFTKKAQVVQGWCYERQYGFNSNHLLMANLYGPREHFHPDRSHGLAALLRKFYEAKRNGAAEVQIWGTGRPVREWLFVKDAVAALVAAAERYDKVEPLNVSVGGGLSIAELAALIADIVGYTGELVYDSSKPDGALMKAFANDRIREEIDWSPTTELRDGIQQTLGWLDEHYERILSEEAGE
ncbi:MAG: NAD-dependent epimerase/dehydratase family protein, partial [Pirellulaceae bacterium]|nr:NAD-dependent epimerase/dehydratase family protein [Pirellulaceae bacterium]